MCDCIEKFFSIVNVLQEFLWEYINFFLILAIGLYFSIKTSFFQFRVFRYTKQTMRALSAKKCGDQSTEVADAPATPQVLRAASTSPKAASTSPKVDPEESKNGLAPTATSRKKSNITPIRLYFTSIGGSIGLGNVVAIVTTVSIGGPGGIFWMWIAVFVGMLVKYGEVYLGIRYRQPNSSGGYDGGPMYYLNKAFNVKFASKLFCILMCVYGVEIFQFSVIENAIVDTFGVNKIVVIAVLLLATLYVTLGGVNRLACVCIVCMPVFILIYTALCIFIIASSNESFIHLLQQICSSAFTGQAAIGGFAGSTFITAAQYGMSNAVYSGDIGMGYDSVIQAETPLNRPNIQARTVVFSLLTDCFICTMTVLVVLSTGVWKEIYESEFGMIVAALKPYCANIQYFLTFFFFLIGWTTILGFLTVGVKSAKFLSATKGRLVYMVYAVVMFLLFSFLEQTKARLIMYLIGGCLMLMNIVAIFILRREIDFSLKEVLPERGTGNQ
jgi:AGCS family alanine or glycine:cation symporter